jgi:hypothetical protein
MNNIYRVFACTVVSVIMICCYGAYRCSNPKYKDPLEIQLGVGELDGWSMSHFVLFLIIGYMYPDEYLLAFVLGVMWELFEHYYGINRPGWLGGYGDCERLASDKETDGNWWYGKWTDILMNLFGLLAGVYMARTREGIK